MDLAAGEELEEEDQHGWHALDSGIDLRRRNVKRSVQMVSGFAFSARRIFFWPHEVASRDVARLIRPGLSSFIRGQAKRSC
jgi:hypothetical protein